MNPETAAAAWAEREARLPKWARDALADLRRDLSRAQREAREARLSTDPEGSSAVLHPYAEVPVGLGPEAMVRFILGPKGSEEWVDVRVEKDPRGRRRLLIRGGTTATISPRASNSFYVDVER